MSAKGTYSVHAKSYLATIQPVWNLLNKSKVGGIGFFTIHFFPRCRCTWLLARGNLHACGRFAARHKLQSVNHMLFGKFSKFRSIKGPCWRSVSIDESSEHYQAFGSSSKQALEKKMKFFLLFVVAVAAASDICENVVSFSHFLTLQQKLVILACCFLSLEWVCPKWSHLPPLPALPTTMSWMNPDSWALPTAASSARPGTRPRKTAMSLLRSSTGSFESHKPKICFISKRVVIAI